MPGFGRYARIPEHVFQFVDAIIGQGSDGLVRAGIDADDRPIAQIVVVVDDGPLVRAWAERLLRPHTNENAARNPGGVTR